MTLEEAILHAEEDAKERAYTERMMALDAMKDACIEC